MDGYIRGEGLTGQIGVVDGYIAAAGIVQDLQLGLVRLCNIGEVLVVIGIYLLRVGLARLVTKVIPLGRREGELRLLDVLGWEELLQVVPLVDISTADMLDLSSAYDRFARFVARLGWYDCVSSPPLGSMRYGRPTERGQIRNVEPEHF